MRTYFDFSEIAMYIEKYNLDMLIPYINELCIMEYVNNEKIFEMGNFIKGIYLHIEGEYNVLSNTPSGKSLFLRRSTPFSIIGDIEFYQRIPIQSNVISVCKTKFIFIPTLLMETKLSGKSQFLKKILYEVTYKLQSCTTASKIESYSIEI